MVKIWAKIFEPERKHSFVFPHIVYVSYCLSFFFMLMAKLIFFPLIFFKMSCPEKLYETIIVQETPQYICALEAVLECVIDKSLVS